MLIKKIFAGFFLMIIVVAVKGQIQSSLGKPISISFNNESIPQSLIYLQTKANINFAFDPAIIPSDIRFTKTYNNTPLVNILNDLLQKAGLSYSLVANQVVIVKRKLSSFTIDGYITDSESGEPLIGAYISISGSKIATITNQYGFYSLTVPAGVYNLTVSHVEYNAEKRDVDVDGSKSVSIELNYKQNNLPEVIVGATVKPDPVAVNQGIRNLTHEQLNQNTYYGGEVDLIKALQMQNGVKALTEGSSGLFVRGGNLDQNLIMLDEAMVYNPSHLFGLVSIFNPDAIKNVQLYKAFMPASFGGRLSSVLDTRMADGNNQDFHVKGGVSLLSFRAAAEGPIVKNKGSFLLTFRRSLIDLLNKDYRLINPNSTYYDVNAKANYQISKNNKVFYSFYGGRDELFSENSYGNQWGNITSTVRWNHVFSSRLFLNLSAIYSNYENSLDLNSDTLAEKKRWQTGIRDKTLKADFTFYRNPFNEIKFGGLLTRHEFIPGQVENASLGDLNIPKDKSWELAAYISQKYNYKDKINIVYGLRVSNFRNAEERLGLYDKNENPLDINEYSTYFGFEPRASISIRLAKDHFTQLSYNRNYQYLQLIQNNELAFSSLETWMPASKTTKPQNSHHLSFGYSYQPEKYSFRINTFYKELFNQLDLLDHTQIIQNSNVRSFLRYGTSTAYGLELGINKQTGKLILGGGYTYTRVFKSINAINNGERFRANWDIPHEFKSSLDYSLTDRFKFNSFFTWASGRPLTLPVGFYYHDGIQVPIFEERNTYRFPNFSRMDISVQYSFPLTYSKHTWKHSFSGGIYNLYNRRNPLYYRISQATENSTLGLINSSTRILPWIAYSFQF